MSWLSKPWLGDYYESQTKGINCHKEKIFNKFGNFVKELKRNLKISQLYSITKVECVNDIFTSLFIEPFF